MLIDVDFHCFFIDNFIDFLIFFHLNVSKAHGLREDGRKFLAEVCLTEAEFAQLADPAASDSQSSAHGDLQRQLALFFLQDMCFFGVVGPRAMLALESCIDSTEMTLEIVDDTETILLEVDGNSWKQGFMATNMARFSMDQAF